MMDTTIRPSYGAFPGVEIPASRILFGTANGPMLAGEDVSPLLDEMLALGINAFDTARGYGRAEQVLGRWMRARGNREALVILSKCGDLKDGVVHLDRQVIEQELAESLRALQTDYIDVYLLHRDDPNTPIAEYMTCLNELKQAGKIRCFGVSNWTVRRIEEANRYARAHDLEGFSVSSPHYGLAEQVADPWGGGCVTVSGNAHAADRAWYSASQMPVVSYSSLSRGFFSGKFRAGDYDGARRALDVFAQRGYLSEGNMARLARAEALAARDGCTTACIAMRYLFSSSMNLFGVCATGSAARMRQNIAASLQPLSARDVRYLEFGESKETANE